MQAAAVIKLLEDTRDKAQKDLAEYRDRFDNDPKEPSKWELEKADDAMSLATGCAELLSVMQLVRFDLSMARIVER